jgi:hypothetical protein
LTAKTADGISVTKTIPNQYQIEHAPVTPHPEPIDPDKTYSIDALAAAVGSSRRTVRGWIRQGLVSVKNGQRVFIVGSDFCDWIKSKKVKK